MTDCGADSKERRDADGHNGERTGKEMSLSEAAISMALNGKPGVSTETRRQVLETAEKYGYDFTKISGRNKGTKTICFALYRKHGAVVADTPFFSELSEGIQKTCKDEGYAFFFGIVGRDSEDMQR